MKCAKSFALTICLLAGAAAASAGTLCPAGNFTYVPDSTGTGCNVVITINPGGSLTVSIKDNTPYDGAGSGEDALIGVVNSSGATVPSLTLTGSGIFGFDGDGICTFVFTGNGYCTTAQVNGTDPLDYAGPTTTFPGWTINTSNSGIVAFTGGLANGATTYFSLEGIPSVTGLTGSVTGTGSTSVPTLGDAGLLLLAMSLVGAAVWKLRTSHQLQ